MNSAVLLICLPKKKPSVNREFRVGLVSLFFSLDNVQTSPMTNIRLTEHT